MKRYPSSLLPLLWYDDFEICIGISEFSVEQTLNLVNLTPHPLTQRLLYPNPDVWIVRLSVILHNLLWGHPYEYVWTVLGAS